VHTLRLLADLERSVRVKKLLVPIFVLSVAALLLIGIRGHWDSWKSDAVLQKTNDAFVTADQIPLSTRITGTVRRVEVEDYQAVQAGQLILELDDRDFKAAVEEAAAAIDAARAQLITNQDAKRAADASIESAREAVAQAESTLEAARAAIKLAQAQVTQATAEYSRQEALLTHRATTHQQFEQATEARDGSLAALDSRHADFSRAQAAIASGKAALAGAEQQRSELVDNDRALNAQIRAKTAALTHAEVNLSYAKIFAPGNGRVGRFQVHPGQLLTAGAQVVPFIQSGAWVEANFQETQLARIRKGDVAEISIDAYPGQTFAAHVAEIAPASGAASALLPPDNATGNFTKVVQRVPVKIVFDTGIDTDALRPGLSVQVTVHTNKSDAASMARLGRG
jgi:membrane fusion protein, multidrug efflux system